MQRTLFKLAAALVLMAMGACEKAGDANAATGVETDADTPDLNVMTTSMVGKSLSGLHAGQPYSICTGYAALKTGRATMVVSPVQIPGEDRSIAFLVVFDAPPNGPDLRVSLDSASVEMGDSQATAAGRYQIGELELFSDLRFIWGDSDGGGSTTTRLRLGIGPDPPDVDLGSGRVFRVDTTAETPSLEQFDIELPRGFDEDPDFWELLGPVLKQLP
jgi:hypothetical protein